MEQASCGEQHSSWEPVSNGQSLAESDFPPQSGENRAEKLHLRENQEME